MSTPSLESLFERYRAQGDLSALGAVFDRTAPELLGLAVHLVRDPVEAEDLVQSTFLAAIEGARSYDATRRLEPWLAGILARTAARALRGRGRQPDARRLAPSPVQDPARRAEEVELAQELRSALDQLGEPYRTVLVQHLAGERPLDIARAQGRAPGTVRMQILRGLERLRRALPTGLFALVPVRAPRGLAGLRTEVLAHGALAGAAALTTAPVLGGVLVSSKSLAAGLAAAGLALLVLWRFTRAPALEGPVTGAATAAELATPPEIAREPLRDAGAVAEREARIGVPALPSTAAVIAAPSATPASGIWLVGRLLGLGEARSEETEIAVTTFQGPNTGGTGSSDGRYALDLTPMLRSAGKPLGAVYVTATHPSQRKTSVEFPLPAAVYRTGPDERRELTLDLDLSPRTVLFGRVRPCEGIAADSVIVGLLHVLESGDFDEGPVEVNCEADGSFLVYPEQSGSFLVVAHTWGLPPVTVAVEAPEGRATDVGTLVLERGGAAIEGELTLAFEVPLSSFRIRASRAKDERAGLVGTDWEGIAIRDERFESVEQVSPVGEDGRFRVEGLVPGAYDLALEGYAPDHIVLSSPAATVVAPAAGVLFGEPYGRVKILVTSPGGSCEGARLVFPIEGGSVSNAIACGEPQNVIVDRRGPLTVEATATGVRGARHELPGGRSFEEALSLELQPELEKATLVLEWSPSAALEALPPLVELTARLHPEGYERFVSVQPGQHAAAFHGFSPGRYEVMLEPRGEDSWTLLGSYACAAPLEVELFAGETTRATVEWRVGGRARFVPGALAQGDERLDVHAVVLDAWDHGMPVRYVTRSYDQGTMSLGARTGSIPIQEPSELEPNLLPGAYVLVLGGDGAEPRRVPLTIRPGETVEVRFDAP